MQGVAGVVERFTRKLRNRVEMMIARGVVRLVNDGGKLQVVQLGLLQGETRVLERFQSYGFTGHPHPGAEAVVLFRGGDRDHGLVVVVDDRRYRLKALAAGEVAMYDDLGKKIHFKRDGTFEAVAPKLVINVTGDVVINAGGNVELGGVGGPAVARVGDNVDVGSGSSAGLWPIVEGSSKVKAT